MTKRDKQRLKPADDSASRRVSPFWGLALVLAGFVLLAGWHSVIVPITQGEDELAHFRYLSFIAQTGRLPATPTEREQAWYRSDWPPLYHLLVGLAVSPLDTTQPHLKDVGESPRRRLVGEIFYPRLIIYTEDANWPWRDAILAWHIGRFLSIVFAAAALLFVFLTALEFAQTWGWGDDFSPAPRSPAPLPIAPGLFATAVTALLAFTPRFIFTSAMLSDDSLFILLSAVYLWLLLRALRGQDGWLTFAAMGLLLGLSVATKYSTALLPLTLLPLVWLKVRRAGWRWTRAAGRLAVAALAAVAGAGWWFGWIIWHFNTIAQDGPFFGLLSPLLASGPDVSMRRVFAFFGGEAFSGQLRPDAVARGDWPGYFGYLFQTYWGVPVLEFDPLWPWAYLPLLAFVIIAAIGLVRATRRADSLARAQIGLLALTGLLLVPFPLLRFFLTYNILETGQGRHILYPAAQSIPILLMLGWLTFWQGRRGAGAQGEHASRITHYALRITFYVFIPPFLLLLWSLWQPLYMARAYPPPLPVQTTTFNAAAIPQPLKHTFGDAVQLLGYDFQPDPGQAIINLTLYWQALAQVDENYRVRVQLTDPAGQPRFTWLSHPLNGRYPTRAWDAGDIIRDSLPLPLAAVPPATYQISVGLLREAEPISVSGEPPFQFIQFDLGQQQPIPNAATLADWQYRLWLPDAPLRPRQTIALSFQNAESRIQNAEAALIGPDGVPRPPAALTDATAIWLVGGDWPGGDYHLSLDGETTPAPVLAVDAPPFPTDLPPELAAQPGWMPLQANFAGQIELLGAALPQRFVQPGGAIPVSLAWRGLAEPLPDAVTFAVLLDAAQQPHGSIDRYPQGFYSPMLWSPGEVVPDNFTLPAAADAPPGVYAIHLGQYLPRPDGSLHYLPLLADGQPTDATAVVLGPLKIGGPPPEVIAPNPQPQHVLNQPFGEQITLLGYEQESGVRSQESGDSNSPNPPNPPNSPNSPNSLHLTLFWQANTIPAADVTTFVHLRDAAGQTVAQKDAPPAGGRYPTSLWEPGEVIADEIVLPLDQLPPGEYTPVVGLYRPDTGERLLTPGHPANEIALQPVRIGE